MATQKEKVGESKVVVEDKGARKISTRELVEMSLSRNGHSLRFNETILIPRDSRTYSESQIIIGFSRNYESGPLLVPTLEKQMQEEMAPAFMVEFPRDGNGIPLVHPAEGKDAEEVQEETTASRVEFPGERDGVLKDQSAQKEDEVLVGESDRVTLAEQIACKEDEMHEETLPAFSNVELCGERDQSSLAREAAGNEVAEVQEETNVFMVQFPEEGHRVPLTSQAVWNEIEEVLKTMLGKRNYQTMLDAESPVLRDLLPFIQENLSSLQKKVKEEMKNSFLLMKNGGDFEGTIDQIYFPLRLKLQKTNQPILPGLRSDVIRILEDSQETNYREVTLDEVKNVTSKRINLYFKEEGKHIVEYPQHLANIPGDWRIDHPDNPEVTCYPETAFYKTMADYTGLEVKQVQTSLFGNDRKRRAGKDLGSKSNELLKKHATLAVEGILRKWQADNPGKKQPDKTLIEATRMTEKQIKDWFSNHAPGRENRNKKTILP